MGMLEIGTLVDGKYKILNKVGQGGMSVVYLAMNEKANKQWAIKEVRKDGVKDFEVVKQSLVAETDMLKKLSHPSLPSIVDVIEDESTFLIVMDYIQGNPLSRALEEYGAQPQEHVIEWAKQLCDVLGYLHTRTPAIIYRDMKPANVMLKPDGNVTLIDFGTAREFKEKNLADTTCLGTVGYAAPEQFGGMGQTDARTDIYCLGATLYHLVTGMNPCEPPYEIRPIREINPSLSGGLEQIILKCTQKSPDRRYHSMAALIADLKKALRSPNEDFVQIENPDEAMATRTVTSRERKEINESRNKEATEGTRLKKNETPQKPKKKKQPVYEEPEEDEEDDEDEEYDDDSRMEKITTLLAIIGAVLIGCAVIFLVGRAVGIFNFGATSAQVTVENVTGKSAAEAQKILEDLGLKVKFAYETSDTVAEGNVISQDVQGGTTVSSGTQVQLTVSGTAPASDTDTIPVPDVLGALEADATATLTRSGFTVTKADGYSDTIEKGKVISQNPVGGSRAASGSAVTIVISQGPDTGSKNTMPAIIGLDVETAVAILTENGFLIGDQKEMSDDTVPAGKVCYASYTAGAAVEPGSTIDIGISVGPKAVTYAYQEAVASPADLDPQYKEGTECTVTITGQSGTEYLKTTVRSFPITTVNLHGMADPAGLITYEYTVTGEATTTTDEDGNLVTVPGTTTRQTVQRQVMFTSEG